MENSDFFRVLVWTCMLFYFLPAEQAKLPEYIFLLKAVRTLGAYVLLEFNTVLSTKMISLF